MLFVNVNIHQRKLSMCQIDRFNPYQLDMIEKIRHKWEKVALSTDPANRKIAEMAVDKFYQYGGRKAPENIIWLNSPFSGAVAHIFLNERWVNDWKRDKKVVVNKLLGNNMYKFLNDLKGKVGLTIEDEIIKFNHHCRNVINDENINWFSDGLDCCCDTNKQNIEMLDNITECNDLSEIENMIDRVLRQEIIKNVKIPVQRTVDLDIGNKVGRRLRGKTIIPLCGSHQEPHLAYLDYFMTEFGLMNWSQLSSRLLLAQSAGWWWPFENAVILTERPIRISRDLKGRLHHESLKAVEYPDGWGIYAWNGVFVPDFVIEHPERISLRTINGMQNLEVRRVLIERYGMDRYLIDSGAKLLHRDEFGDLFLKTEERDEDIKMVKVQNSTPEPDGSFRNYFLRVPPWIQTAKKAVAWTFDMNEGEYQPQVES